MLPGIYGGTGDGKILWRTERFEPVGDLIRFLPIRSVVVSPRDQFLVTYCLPAINIAKHFTPLNIQVRFPFIFESTGCDTNDEIDPNPRHQLSTTGPNLKTPSAVITQNKNNGSQLNTFPILCRDNFMPLSCRDVSLVRWFSRNSKVCPSWSPASLIKTPTRVAGNTVICPLCNMHSPWYQGDFYRFSLCLSQFLVNRLQHYTQFKHLWGGDGSASLEGALKVIQNYCIANGAYICQD